MAAADKTTDTAAAQPSATVAPQQYSGTGWQVGDTAPSDAYRALDDTGAPTGPVVSTHPGDRAVQIVAEGGQITDGVRQQLDAAQES